MCHSFTAKSPIVVTHLLPLRIPDHNPCLLRMYPLCHVPYPIILCPCSKTPCLSIVLLTCNIFPIGHNNPQCLLSFLAKFSENFPSALLSPFSLLTFTSIIFLGPFSLHPDHLIPSSHFYIDQSVTSSLPFLIFSIFYVPIPVLHVNTVGLMSGGGLI